MAAPLGRYYTSHVSGQEPGEVLFLLVNMYFITYYSVIDKYFSAYLWGLKMSFRSICLISLIYYVLILLAGCDSITRDDFLISGDTAYIDKSMEQYPSNFILAWDIARHVVAGMKFVEDQRDLKHLKVVVFTYTGELTDKYGNKREGTWTRVAVPVEEWLKYSKEIRSDARQVQKRMLADWIVGGFPLSSALRKELAEK